VFLNLDAGELPDEPEALWALADVINCACGGHAGDAASMSRVAAFCARSSVRLGAHPSYPDREQFGRRSLELEPVVLAASLANQCRELAVIATTYNLAITSVKPHGALYHDAATTEAVAVAVVRAAVEVLGHDLLIIGPPHGALHAAAERYGLRYAREGFADRAMRSDGSLVPRSEAGALITDPREAADQASRLASSVDTICVHGDTPNALEIARAVRDAVGEQA
jgi:UPF0271 protein